MEQIGIKSPQADLSEIGLNGLGKVYWNLTPAQLVEHTLSQDQGKLSDSGALVVKTGAFTGRSPKDRFIVKDEKTTDTVYWGDINIPFTPEKFDLLKEKVFSYLKGKTVYARDAYACASENHRLNLRVVTEYPWQNLFANNLFLRPDLNEIEGSRPDWTVVAAPGFHADPEIDGTRQSNFAIINFTQKMILIGGTAYTGEIKKGIFSVLNYLLPQERKVLSMHCSANIGKNNDSSLFFGLSGTGKTTLSADPERKLIGDDEHGWEDDHIFNFEGGCYAKCIDLTEETEPQIFNAIKFGALVENTVFKKNTRTIDFEDSSITENTRVAYPIDYIDNIVKPSVGPIPKNLFFLTCDAFGVLPPISKLTKGQAMYHFISGYTAKVAGTEAGITEPKLTFSACFGAPFLPLHPTKYAEMLGEKMEKYNVNVWLINTGWTGGPYGVGERMKLKYTRAMITAALRGELDNVEYQKHSNFGLATPQSCPNVPDEVLNPRNTWSDKNLYDAKASELANAFVSNFKKFESFASVEIKNAEPVA
ncbi:MAG: phosphoenolpyruvate carboxykinase (ATP) [Chitinophagaceae bacterium]|nr:MAG: phosphoenolpyruvate carboxykinase (ATP) [Chitinophagaceae bacterium]